MDIINGRVEGHGSDEVQISSGNKGDKEGSQGKKMPKTSTYKILGSVVKVGQISSFFKNSFPTVTP